MEERKRTLPRVKHEQLLISVVSAVIGFSVSLFADGLFSLSISIIVALAFSLGVPYLFKILR